MAYLPRIADECDQLQLLALFEPLLGHCARRAALMLPDADRAVLRAEADYGFLLLLSQYDPAAGVPFAGYIKTKLLFHMFNWCRSEQKRIWGEAAWEDETFDEKISAAWMNRNAFLGGGVGEWASGCVGKWRSCQSVKNR